MSESINMIDLTESDDENTPPSPCREKSFSISTMSNAKLKSAVVPLCENRRILNEVTNTVETVTNAANALNTVANVVNAVNTVVNVANTVANVANTVNTVANAVNTVPNVANTVNTVANAVNTVPNVANTVNTVANAVMHHLTGSTISSQVNTQRVSGQNTEGFGCNYNQSSVNSHRRNKQSRNHNNRPYDRNRHDNQYRQNRYGSTDSPSWRNNTQLLTFVEVAMECY